MTPHEREQRTEVMRGLHRGGLTEKVVDLQERLELGWRWLGSAQERAQRAEAAARDFAEALRRISEQPQFDPAPASIARDVLARHPSFSGPRPELLRMALARRAAVFHGLETARQCVRQAGRDPEAWALYVDWYESHAAPEDVTPADAIASIERFQHGPF